MLFRFNFNLFSFFKSFVIQIFTALFDVGGELINNGDTNMMQMVNGTKKFHFLTEIHKGKI